MKIAIVGSREFNTDKYKDIIFDVLNKFFKEHLEYIPTCVISGHAKGPDTFGELWANENNLETIIIPPNWKKYGMNAGFIRNVDIITQCDLCIAFWDGKSKGTNHDIHLCQTHNKPCYVWTPVWTSFNENNSKQLEFDF